MSGTEKTARSTGPTPIVIIVLIDSTYDTTVKYKRTYRRTDQECNLKIQYYNKKKDEMSIIPSVTTLL